jgi:predicted P-loop ATPase
MIEENESLIRQGAAIVFLRPFSKRPLEDAWSSKPKLTYEQAKKNYPGGNVGIRLGEPSRIGTLYVHGIDLDIRDKKYTAEALSALAKFVGRRQLPHVVSGSGAGSRHFYFLTDKSFRPKKLAHSDALIGSQWAWEIDLGGTGRQFVLPPSIHPTTRKPYLWGAGEPPVLADLPVIPSVLIEMWRTTGSRKRESLTSDLADLVAQVASEPARFNPAEINSVLDTLLDHRDTREEWLENRDGWLKIGFAIHHQFEGSEQGFETWCDFSAGSDKFDPEDSRRVWDSMGRGGIEPVTFRTLYMIARRAGLSDAYGFEIPAPEASAADVDAMLDQLASEQTLEQARTWKQELDVDDNDKLKSTTTNLALILANDDRLKGVIAQNDFTHEIMQMANWGTKTPAMFAQPLQDKINGDLWTDAHDVNLTMFLSTRPQGRIGGYGFKPSDPQVKKAIVSAAMHNRFHPVRSFLREVLWDGKPRLDHLFVNYLETPDRAYFREAAALMMIAAVVRIFEPGHKFDFAAVIEGPEGRRKSTFIETIGAHWYGHLNGNFGDRKDMVEKMQGKWILEIPDLTGMAKSAVEDIKAFMSAGRDHVRLAYAHRAGDFARQSVFWGTTNNRHYLASETGNRRFLPIPSAAATIDTERLERNLRQIWAEAYARFRALRKAQPRGRLPLYLSGTAAADEAFLLQRDRKIESTQEVLAGRIEEWLATPIVKSDLRESVAVTFVKHADPKTRFIRTRTCIAQIWDEMMGFSGKPITDRETKDISAALHALNEWRPERLRFEFYGRQRCIIRNKASAAEVAAGVKIILSI